jgi:hypothetical protein
MWVLSSTSCCNICRAPFCPCLPWPVLLGLFPVHGHDEVFVALAGVHFQQAVGLLGVVAAEEEPAVARSFAGVAQVEVHSRGHDLEGDAHLAVSGSGWMKLTVPLKFSL